MHLLYIYLLQTQEKSDYAGGKNSGKDGPIFVVFSDSHPENAKQPVKTDSEGSEIPDRKRCIHFRADAQAFPGHRVGKGQLPGAKQLTLQSQPV